MKGYVFWITGILLLLIFIIKLVIRNEDIRNKKRFWGGFFTALLGIVIINILIVFSVAVFSSWTIVMMHVIIHFVNILVFLPSLFIFGFVGKEKGIFAVCKRLIIMGIIVITFIIIFSLVTKIN